MVYKKEQPNYLNCIRIKYIEDSYKKVGIKRAIVLSNCFANKVWIGSIYSNVLECDIIKYMPQIFRDCEYSRCKDKLSEFYMITIKSKVK